MQIALVSAETLTAQHLDWLLHSRYGAALRIEGRWWFCDYFATRRWCYGGYEAS